MSDASNFFTQLKTIFFPKLIYNHRLELFRNYFFNESYDYDSNILTLLQFISFFIQVLNFKHLDVVLIQKPVVLINFYETYSKGIDFWGDKDNNKKSLKSNENLPIKIIDNIIHDQINYVNLRKEFEKFKSDLSYILEDIRNCNNTTDPIKSMKTYFQTSLTINVLLFLNMFQRAKESSILQNDRISLTFLTRAINHFKDIDYYRNNQCEYPSHISSRTMKFFKSNDYNFTDKNNSILSLQRYFKNNMNIISSEGIIDISFLIDSNMNYFYPEVHGLKYIDYDIYQDVKNDIINISDKKFGEIRNFQFRITNYVEKYIIYLEISRYNTDINLINDKKIQFLEYYLKIIEFKFKFMIILLNKYVPQTKDKFEAILNGIKEISKSIPENFENIEKLSDIKVQIQKPTNTLSKLFKNINTIKDAIDNQHEKLIKIENTAIIEKFLHTIHNLFELYRREVKIHFINKSINTIIKENNSLNEMFLASKNDLDISKFRNNFSSSLIKELDDSNIININNKFPFFESFVNKIQNLSLECDTHSNSSALLFVKTEFVDALKNMIKDFLVFDINHNRSKQSLYVSEKFGYYLTIKKLEIKNNILSSKVLDYEQNFEKISNAKLALTGNKMVFEMDNLYRQLKVLKENMGIMEDYLKSYFEQKFKEQIISLETNIDKKQAEFEVFKKEMVNISVQKISEEYNKALSDLKNKSIFMTETLENIMKRREEDITFNDIFYKELEIESKFTKLLNQERHKNEKLHKTIANLHTFYRLKLQMKKIKHTNAMNEMKQTLSSNQDLWNKLSNTEKNEKILKEELARSQKNLASSEEFIKKLQSQIRKLHDKNVELEKIRSNNSTMKNMNSGGNIENGKMQELLNDTKQTQIYNLKDNLNLISAIERTKHQYKDEKDIKLILESFDLVHGKFMKEVENKRNYITMLNKIKEDVSQLKFQENAKYKELESRYESLNNEFITYKSEKKSSKVLNSFHSNKRQHNELNSLREESLTNHYQTVDARELPKIYQSKTNSFEKVLSEENNSSKSSSKPDKDLSKFKLSAQNIIFGKNEKI